MNGVDAGGPVPSLQCLQNFKMKRDKDGKQAVAYLIPIIIPKLLQDNEPWEKGRKPRFI